MSSHLQFDLDFAAQLPKASPRFDGETYEPEKDQSRLWKHLQKLVDLTRDRRWRTLGQIAAEIGCTEASASARLRDLRKSRFGAYTVNRRRVDGGLFEYQVIG